MGGCSSGNAVTPLTTGNNIAPAAIQVDRQGLIAILDPGNFNPQDGTIYSYGAPVDGSLGFPVFTTDLGQGYYGEWGTFAITPNNREVIVNNTHDTFTTTFSYGGSGYSNGYIQDEYPFSVATYPSEEY